MRIVRFDTEGRLLEFHSMTPQVDDPAPARDVSWTPLFDAAGLQFGDFHPVEPRWAPRSDADLRAAWQGRMRDLSGADIRVEAAAYHGTPISSV